MSGTLSIITISSFDHSRLEATLNSLLTIDLSIEHIIVFPKQDHETFLISSEYSRKVKFPVVLINDEGNGVYAAMNIGANVATGKYIIFWNSGDFLTGKLALSKTLTILIRDKPVWAIVQGTFAWRNPQIMTLKNIWEFVCQNSQAYISHQTILVSNEYFKRMGGFNTKFIVAADNLFITKILLSESPQFIDENVVVVETPGISSKLHRRGRAESYLISIAKVPIRKKFRGLKNIIGIEIAFICKKIRKSLF